MHRDIKTFNSSELLALYGNKKKKILVGCAPCQPFSIYNRKSSSVENRPEDKWELLYSFSDLIDETEPEIISMENVPLVVTFDGGKVFKDFINRLEAKNYLVSWSIVNAQDYGVAQRRKRLILFGTKFGEKITLVDPTIKDGKYMTVQDAIGHLPHINDGEAHPNDPLHYSKKLNDLNKERIRATPKVDLGKIGTSVYG